MLKNVTPTKNMSFSKIEVEHLFKSWAAITVAFAIIMSQDLFSLQFLYSLLISGVAVGFAFIVHELSHKFVAQKYHCTAEFRANFPMLGLMFVLAILFKVIFAAPGGVLIQRGYLTRKQYGKIALAGPLSNLILAVFFLLVAFVARPGIVDAIGVYGFMINSWLALFNLLPFGSFDGSKILHWNKTVFYIMIGASFILLALSQNLVL
jgi:Zn-dependent protease